MEAKSNQSQQNIAKRTANLQGELLILPRKFLKNKHVAQIFADKNHQILIYHDKHKSQHSRRACTQPSRTSNCLEGGLQIIAQKIHQKLKRALLLEES